MCESLLVGRDKPKDQPNKKMTTKRIWGEDNKERTMIKTSVQHLDNFTDSMPGTGRLIAKMLKEGYGCPELGYHFIETKVAGMNVVWFKEIGS